MLLTQRLSPRPMDAFIRRFGFQLQRTDEPKPEDAPNNLLAPIQGYDRVEGDFSTIATPRSLYNWLETHPAIWRGALAGAALGAIAGLAARSVMNRG
jgi:hypothetical protein